MNLTYYETQIELRLFTWIWHLKLDYYIIECRIESGRSIRFSLNQICLICFLKFGTGRINSKFGVNCHPYSLHIKKRKKKKKPTADAFWDFGVLIYIACEKHSTPFLPYHGQLAFIRYFIIKRENKYYRLTATEIQMKEGKQGEYSEYFWT